MYWLPNLYDGEPDNHWDTDPCENRGNAFENVGPMLSQSVRMACGSSTSTQFGRSYDFWDGLTDDEYGVADSWCYARDENYVRHMCMTTGDESFSSTPLYNDSYFNSRSNEGGDYYHLQYYSDDIYTQSEPRSAMTRGMEKDLQREIPSSLPIIWVSPQEITGKASQMSYTDGGAVLISEEQAEEGITLIKIRKASGSQYVRGPQKEVSYDDEILKNEEYVQKASEFAVEWGWLEENASEPRIDRILIQRYPVQEARVEHPGLKKGQKNVRVIFPRASEK
jgi:hypothetical protein